VKNLILALVAVAFTGCTLGRAFTEEQNANNGAQGNLSFLTRDTAAGASSFAWVTYSDKGTYDCTTSPEFLNGGGYTDCEYAGQPLHLVAVTKASCDGIACTATIEAGGVRVSSIAVETVTLHVTASLSDGTIVDDSFGVTFVAATKLEVTCNSGELCPGPQAAIFTGSQFHLSPTVTAGDDTLVCDVASAVEPAGVVDVSNDGEYLVKALGAGTATVTFSCGALTRSQTVRVVDTSAAVSGKVYLPTDGQTLAVTSAGNDLIGTLAPSTMEAWIPLLVVWTLNDGMQIIGNAAQVQTTTQGMTVELESGGTTSSALMFEVGSTPGAVCQPGAVRLTATVGSAVLDQTFNLTCS
jgi:hypothetical protein